jgi:hypothetical protein
MPTVTPPPTVPPFRRWPAALAGSVPGHHPRSADRGRCAGGRSRLSLWLGSCLGSVLCALGALSAVGCQTVADEAPALSIAIHHASGGPVASATGQGSVSLAYPAAYQPGDVVTVLTSPAHPFLVITIDDHVPASQVMLPAGRLDFAIPTGVLTTMYDPLAFRDPEHHISARLARPAELAAYRNVAVDSLDQRGNEQCFPHAQANAVTRGEPQFFERNAIDGVVHTEKHGHWPYDSWGNGQTAHPWITIRFGRPVRIDTIRLYVRADYPHDGYWTSATVTCSDGSTRPMVLQRTGVTWVTIGDFVQPVTPLAWVGLTEVQVLGADATVPAQPSSGGP